MFTERIPLGMPLAKDFEHELERRVFFVSDKIVDFSFIEAEEFIQEVEVITSEPIDRQSLGNKLNFLIANDIAGQKALPTTTIWRSPHQRSTYYDDMFDCLVTDAIAFEVGEGQICLGEPFIKLMDYFDRTLKMMVMTTFDAKEYRYPTLISTDALKKCGYFDSFPHFLMFVTRLHNDIDVYRAFLDAYRGKDSIDSAVFSFCQNVDYCLPPTMCYHTYHQYQGRQLGEGKNMVVTSRGKSFRFESRYYRSLERLWDFTIREIVFIGSRDYVLECRQKFMDLSLGFMEQLGLVGYCEVANDPFFCDVETAQKAWSQKLLELKYELRLNVTAERTLAAASFNFHDLFFGQSFNIKRGDDWIRTGCVGFGLERLTYAFLCQHGLDQRRWPELVLRGLDNE